MTFREIDDSLHLAEKQLKEFGQTHVENCTKFQDAGQRILLNLSITATLFAANIGYHKSCYQAFRVPSWKKTHSKEMYCSKRNYIDKLSDVIEYLAASKREVYTPLKQLRELCANIKGVGVDSIRSINIKNLIEKQLEGEARCCMPKSAKRIQSGYVIYADANILPDAINAIVTGEGVTNYMQLKAISRSILFDIQGREKISWPPAPRDILESNEFLDLNKRLFDLIAWIVSPNAAMDKDGFVGLSYRKATKISEIVQNIQLLVPGVQPGFNQILLSITMLAKAVSQMVVNNLKQLGHGLLNAEIVLIQDKWAEETERLNSIIPSNIKVGVYQDTCFRQHRLEK